MIKVSDKLVNGMDGDMIITHSTTVVITTFMLFVNLYIYSGFYAFQSVFFAATYDL